MMDVPVSGQLQLVLLNQTERIHLFAPRSVQSYSLLTFREGF